MKTQRLKYFLDDDFLYRSFRILAFLGYSFLSRLYRVLAVLGYGSRYNRDLLKNSAAYFRSRVELSGDPHDRNPKQGSHQKQL